MTPAIAPEPRLLIRCGGADTEWDQARVVIGREAGCDVVVVDPNASRHHIEVRRTQSGWVAVDSSSNGTFVNGQRVSEVTIGSEPIALSLGAVDGERVELALVLAAESTRERKSGERHRALVVPPGQLSPGRAMLADLPAGRDLSGGVSIGREPTNDVVLDDPLVSRYHARLESAPHPVVRDLGSFNGTFVDGRRIEGAVDLESGAEVIVGNQRFRWDGAELVASASAHEFTLYADGLTTIVKGDKRLLENVSFQLDPSSFTAVIGPSGSGKSTLLDALTGLRPATQGRVIWQGHDLYTHYDQLRFQIGLVPQQDIQHPQLTVRQALGYAAELRLPPDTTSTERSARVQAVAASMQLEGRLDNRIGTELSGGQRKRVSIASELLTAPPLLFLDEPTSGLDPGLDLEVMRQLRTLSDEGRVVVVVTHSVLALDLCDTVVVLAPGGRIAYFGPPDGVLAHFGCASYPEVFDMLDDADLWDRIERSPVSTATQQLDVTPTSAPSPPQQSASKQFSTLARRNLAVVFADRLLLAMLIGMPLVLGALSRVVPGEGGLSLDALRTGGGDGTLSEAEALKRLTVLVVSASLIGTALTIRELVGERAIFRREYAVGLSPGIYLISKVAVLGTAAFLQGVIVTFLATVGLPGPDDGGAVGLGRLEVAFAIGLLATTMAVVGLTLSAVVTSSEQTMPALVGLVMVQLVLSGALVEVAGRPVLAQLAWLAPARWGYAASATSAALERPKRERGQDVDWIAQAGVAHYMMNIYVLFVLLGMTFAVGLHVVRRSATRSAA